MKRLAISLFIFFPLILHSQNVTLKGTAKGAEGKTLDIYAYSELLSYTLEKIASGPIDATGNFNFSFTINETIFTYVKIGFTRAPLYVEPGKTYDLLIACEDCNLPDDKTNPYLNPKDLVLTIGDTDSTELNNLIYHFNLDYDKFIYNHYISLIKLRNKEKLDTFRMQINQKYSSIKNQYFNDLVRYRVAAIEHMAQLSNENTLTKKFLVGQKVLYQNTGYMEFINGLFTDYVTMISNKIKKADLEKTINDLQSMPAFLDSLGKDSLLKNEAIREMVAIKCLSEIYYTKNYDQTAILKMLKHIEDSSKFSGHKTAAKNFKNFFTKLTKGSAAPAFTLKDMNGQSYSLSELNNGKYVYLIFWTSWCVPCITDMELIGKLIEKYGTKVSFVGISCDKEFMTFYNYMNQKAGFEFTTLHWNNNSLLLEDYDVKSYPKYLLIDPEGKIFMNPAEAPSGALDALFKDLTKIKK